MRLLKNNFFLSVIGSLLLFSCEETVEVPIEPAVSFKALSVMEFEETPEFFQLQFHLTDGDGDIGLQPDHDFVPFHEFDLILDVNNQLVRKSNVVTPPFFRLRPNGERFFFSEEDERPGFSEFNYMLMDSVTSGEQLSDTVLIHRNVFHHNIYISILKKVGDDFVYSAQSDFDTSRPPISGRFMVPEASGKEEPVISEVSYEMSIERFSAFRAQDTLKLEFYIFDRKLNQSNVEMTPEFRLSDLIQWDEEG